MDFLGIELLNKTALIDLVIRLTLDLLVTYFIVSRIYYSIKRDKEFVFTFYLFNVLIFLITVSVHSAYPLRHWRSSVFVYWSDQPSQKVHKCIPSIQMEVYLQYPSHAIVQQSPLLYIVHTCRFISFHFSIVLPE